MSCLKEDKGRAWRKSLVWMFSPGRDILTSKTSWFACHVYCGSFVYERMLSTTKKHSWSWASPLISIQIPCEQTGRRPVCQGAVCLVLEQPLPLGLLTAPTAVVPVGGGMDECLAPGPGIFGAVVGRFLSAESSPTHRKCLFNFFSLSYLLLLQHCLQTLVWPCVIIIAG